MPRSSHFIQKLRNPSTERQGPTTSAATAVPTALPEAGPKKLTHHVPMIGGNTGLPTSGYALSRARTLNHSVGGGENPGNAAAKEISISREIHQTS
ncbi:hypothetical protein Nepgr_023985 [Nepenthes gracilis]|uniref:Uncharacterized protein n=1 Tax=Nepenthes gracilis TaxID=150966 RepID=A0AAD3T4Y9_NEPGR|nr:hypothetical protein Nepgr_023985 [Nepenthes gracilis]